MSGIIAGLLLLGAICGAFIRIVLFIIILVGAALVAALSTVLHGDENPIVMAVLAVVLMQVGYAAGIALRALLHARQRRHSDQHRAEPERLPTAQKK